MHTPSTTWSKAAKELGATVKTSDLVELHCAGS